MDHIKIVDKPFAKIQSAKVSAFGKVFLVETENEIQKISTITNPQ